MGGRRTSDWLSCVESKCGCTEGSHHRDVPSLGGTGVLGIFLGKPPTLVAAVRLGVVHFSRMVKLFGLYDLKPLKITCTQAAKLPYSAMSEITRPENSMRVIYQPAHVFAQKSDHNQRQWHDELTELFIQKKSFTSD
jgi:hypothetical protein